MGKIPKSMREKKRYIAFKVRSDFKIKKEELSMAIWGNALSMLGEMKASKLNYWLIEYDEEKMLGILTCSHRMLSEMLACLALVSNVNNKMLSIVTLGVSGTLKALRRKFLKGYYPIREVSFKAKFRERDIKVVRSYNNFIDAEISEQEISERLGNMNMRYIGLIKEEIEDATFSEHGI